MKVKTKKNTSNTKTCTVCKKQRAYSNFVKGNDKDGYCVVCTDCRKKMAKDVDGLRKYCEISNRNFSTQLWNLCMELAEQQIHDKLDGLNIKQTSKKIEERAINLYFSKMNINGLAADGEIEEQDEPSTTVTKKDIPSEIISKWGKGFKPEEYLLFEEKYQRLKNSFQLPTESHREFLQKACVCSVKADRAMAEGDFKQAKEWMSMFKDVTSAGKLQPSQMSKADLSGGMDTFGQLSKMVEQAVDIIPILPKFKKKPFDAVDFNIWCYVNYIRQMMDLSLVEYEEIYKFYEDRKKDFEESRSHLQTDEEGDF